MGRFGNVMLVSGSLTSRSAASRGEVVRFFLTNTANTRVFNVTLPGARMKLVGADSGHYEREEYVEEVLIAPSERVVIDVLFDQPGELALVHRTPEREYRLAGITVGEEASGVRLSQPQFDTLRTNADMAAERERVSRTSQPRQTRRSRSSQRWTWANPTGQSSTHARCTRRSSATSLAHARSAA